MATLMRAAAVFLTVSLYASAQSFWDGNAAIQRGDPGFDSGAFAASNSFPADTEIVVENLETGRTARAVVSQRINGQSDLLVLLSPKAAEELGMSLGQITPVRVTIKGQPPSVGEKVPTDLAYSQDPDINPAAASPAASPSSSAEAASLPAAGTVESLPPADRGAKDLLALAPAPEPKPEEKAPSGDSAAAERAPDNPAFEEELKKLAARVPQKQLFLPPREDERFAYKKPASETKTPEKPPVKEVKLPETTKTGEPVPDIPTVNSLAGHVPLEAPRPDLALAEAGLPIEMNPEVNERIAAREPSAEAPPAIASLPEPEAAGETPPETSPLTTELGEAPPTPPEGEVETIIALEPAAPRPPEETKTEVKTVEKPPEVIKTEGKPPAEITLTPSEKRPPGKRGSVYLQLAAYASEKQARDTAAGLSAVYPVSVSAPQGVETPLYRILVGPLNRAESGTLLLWFRYRGFPDAFVKAGE